MTLQLAAIQHDIAWESPTETITAVRPLVLDAAEQGATLISLTEMWACGFSMNTAVVAEPPDGRTATTMHELAEETGCWIAGSFPEHTAGHDRPTNRFLLAGQTAKITVIPRPSRSRLPAKPTTTTAARRSNRSWSRVSASPHSSVTTCASPTSSGMRRGHRPLSRSGQLARRAS